MMRCVGCLSQRINFFLAYQDERDRLKPSAQ
jgi:hypothetical protein